MAQSPRVTLPLYVKVDELMYYYSSIYPKGHFHEWCCVARESIRYRSPKYLAIYEPFSSTLFLESVGFSMKMWILRDQGHTTMYIKYWDTCGDGIVGLIDNSLLSINQVCKMAVHDAYAASRAAIWNTIWAGKGANASEVTKTTY